MTPEERTFARRLHAAAIERGKAEARLGRLSGDLPACFRMKALTEVCLAHIKWLRVYIEICAHFDEQGTA